MKLKWFFSLVFLVFAAANSTAQQRTSEFVGYEHKGVIYGATLPNGARDLGGGLLSNENYGVSRFSKNGKLMLWLERIVEFDADGVPSWTVKDVLTFARPKKTQEFLFSYGSTCRQNGAENLDLIVLAELRPPAKNYKIINAWRANVEKEKFEKVSIKGIECVAVEP